MPLLKNKIGCGYTKGVSGVKHVWMSKSMCEIVVKGVNIKGHYGVGEIVGKC